MTIREEYDNELMKIDVQLLDAVTAGFTVRRKWPEIKKTFIKDLQKQFIDKYGEQECIDAKIV